MYQLVPALHWRKKFLWQHHYIKLKYILFIILHLFSHNLAWHIWYCRKCWALYWNLKWSSVGLNKHRLHSRSLYWPKPTGGLKRLSMNMTSRGRLCCFSPSDFTHWESSRTKSWTWSTNVITLPLHRNLNVM